MDNTEGENDLLSRIDGLVSSKLSEFEKTMTEAQKRISETQLEKLKLKLDTCDNYQFRKRGKEEQFKLNKKVLGSLAEARNELEDSVSSGSTKAEAATQKVIEGLKLKDTIIDHVNQTGVAIDSFGELPDKMAQKLLGSRSDNTNIKYISYFKKWDKFISEKGGNSLPASPIHIALYITDLLEKRCSDHVISATVYSLKWAHGLKGLPDPTENSFVKNLLENAKWNNYKPTSKKEPLSTKTLIDVCSEYSESSDILVVRDLSMILLGFAGFLRYDELSSLRCNDIVFHDDHFCLKIRKSKTDQYRLGNEIVISKGMSLACSYEMLRRYLTLSSQTIFDSNYLFRPCFRSNSTCKLIYKDKPLSYSRARECIISRLRPFTGGFEHRSTFTTVWWGNHSCQFRS